jgi:catechol 2,3-dioxygenase-like lactoylglutathione lyase family enzyme
MLDHVGFSVSDLAAARQFYGAALKPLGITCQMEVTPEMTGDGTAHVGYGVVGKPFFWIGTGDRHHPGVHVAFAAENRAIVDEFYKAALAAGGADNGPPGLRPHYHPDYYGAFVRDPDGNNIEAVCHRPG